MQSTFRKVIVTGANGQLGRCLHSIAPQTDDLKIYFFGKADFDLRNKAAMQATIDELEPDYIINCAAYTNVDDAEDEIQEAQALNYFALVDLCNICSEKRIKLMHISTDFAFDGKARKPYPPDSPTDPINAYGQSKVLGERAILHAIPEDAMIIRTSWLYSEYGSNFVKTILHLYNTRKEFHVVHNQKGTPTYARGLAEVIWHVIETRQFSPGIYHWCDKGQTTWYDFAIAIGEKGVRKGLIENKGAAFPILSSEYPAKARRPMYSCLYSYPTLKRYSKLRQYPWQDQLEKMLDVLVDSKEAAVQ